MSRFLNLVDAELALAEASHAPLRSLHEGYAVLLEEVDELWDEVRKQSGFRDDLAAATELVRIAAMAARLYQDMAWEPLHDLIASSQRRRLGLLTKTAKPPAG